MLPNYYHEMTLSSFLSRSPIIAAAHVERVKTLPTPASFKSTLSSLLLIAPSLSVS